MCVKKPLMIVFLALLVFGVWCVIKAEPPYNPPDNPVGGQTEDPWGRMYEVLEDGRPPIHFHMRNDGTTPLLFRDAEDPWGHTDKGMKPKVRAGSFRIPNAGIAPLIDVKTQVKNARSFEARKGK